MCSFVCVGFIEHGERPPTQCYGAFMEVFLMLYNAMARLEKESSRYNGRKLF